MGFIKLNDGKVIHTRSLPSLTNDKMKAFPYDPETWRQINAKLKHRQTKYK